MSARAAGALACVWSFALSVSPLAMADMPAGDHGLTADGVIQRNIAARGGTEAWRKIRTMIWTGHIENVHAPGPWLPFILAMQRPNKMRFEMQTQASVRIFDGAHGWKMRPGRGGSPEVRPYNAEEMIFTGEGLRLGGPLMDYQLMGYRAAGITLELDGMEQVEGRLAYRLRARFASGNSYHIWIDAQTFLDVKYDRASRNALGQLGTAWISYRNFKTTGGVQIPLVIESGTGASTEADRMVIDNVTLNAPLEDRLFTEPVMPGGVLPDVEPVREGRGLPPAIPRARRNAPVSVGAR